MHLSWFPVWNQHDCADISLHTGRCVDWEKTGADWVTVPLFFLGAFAGANNIYRMVQKFLKPEDDGRAVRQTPGRQSTTETEISDSISRVEKDVKKNK